MTKILTGFTVLLLSSGAPALAGGIYSYVDERGVKIYTNSPVRNDSLETTSSSKRAGKDRAAPYRPIIRRLAAEHDLDHDLVEAIISVESAFDPKAVSVKDCKGLMQLHPDTAARYGVEDVFDPEQNIEGGVKYLSFLVDEFDGKLEHVLAAYNAGENAVRRYQGIPPYAETRDYVKKIARRYDFSRWELTPEPAPEGGGRRVHRIELADGRVVFTNTPSLYTDTLQ